MTDPTHSRSPAGAGSQPAAAPTGCPFHVPAPSDATGALPPRPDTCTGSGATPPASRLDAAGVDADALTQAVAPPATGSPIDAGTVAQQTLLWVEKAVVGLNLCPFANAVLRKNRLRIHVSEATDREALLDDLRNEAKRLVSRRETELETSLLVCPRMLHDFLDFNDFLNEADELLCQMDLEGVLQLASFHPHYQFASTRPDDIDNATNQSPWPTLHLLRESSIDRAVAAMGDETDQIYENNIARLRAMGAQGWQALQACWQSQDDVAAPRHGGADSSSLPALRGTEPADGSRRRQR